MISLDFSFNAALKNKIKSVGYDEVGLAEASERRNCKAPFHEHECYGIVRRALT